MSESDEEREDDESKCWLEGREAGILVDIYGGPDEREMAGAREVAKSKIGPGAQPAIKQAKGCLVTSPRG
jgi:hypothetical protein